MLNDAKAGQMFALLHQNISVAQVAKTLHMGERTIRQYRDHGSPQPLDASVEQASAGKLAAFACLEFTA
jgi:hypothetical protein